MIKETLFACCVVFLFFGFRSERSESIELSVATECQNYQLFSSMMRSNLDPYDLPKIRVDIDPIPDYQTYYTKYVYKENLGIDLCKQWLPLSKAPIYIHCVRVDNTTFNCDPYTSKNLAFNFKLICTNIDVSGDKQCYLDLSLDVINPDDTREYLLYRNMISNLRVSFIYMLLMLTTYVICNINRDINVLLMLSKIFRVGFVVIYYIINNNSNMHKLMVTYTIILFFPDIFDHIYMSKIKRRTE